VGEERLTDPFERRVQRLAVGVREDGPAHPNCERERQQRRQRREAIGRVQREDDGDDVGHAHERKELRAARPVAQIHREGLLPGGHVRLAVADVVDDEDGRREPRGRQARHDGVDRYRAGGQRRRERPDGGYTRHGLDVVGAGDGDQAEVDENEEVTEAAVAVRERPAGVEDARGDAREADDDDGDAADSDQRPADDDC